MNTVDPMNQVVPTHWDGHDESRSGGQPDGSTQRGFGQRTRNFLLQLLLRALGGEQRPPSILRNNTNLPVFLVLALGLSLVCNFALKENTAQASRLLGPAATLNEAQELLARNPEDPALHSRMGELYLQQRNYKRAMFHFRESGRLSDLYGE